VQDASGDDSRGGECLAHDPAHPRTICHSYRSNLHTHCVQPSSATRSSTVLNRFFRSAS
jgi:hypothetical protein